MKTVKRIAAVFLAVLLMTTSVFASSNTQKAWKFLSKEKYGDYGNIAALVNGEAPSRSDVLNLIKSSQEVDKLSVSEASLKVLALKTLHLKEADEAAKAIISELSQRNLSAMQPSQTRDLSLALAAAKACGNDLLASSLLKTLLSFQNEDGGFPDDGEDSTVYATQYALLALSLFDESSEAKNAAKKALDFLAATELKPKNCDQTAVLVCALASNGVKNDDERFFVSDMPLYDYMMSFEHRDGGFIQNAGDASQSVIATEQAMLALYAVENGRSPFDAANIKTEYRPPSVKDNIFAIIKKMLIVLAVIYGSLLFVNRLGKKRAEKQ